MIQDFESINQYLDTYLFDHILFFDVIEPFILMDPLKAPLSSKKYIKLKHILITRKRFVLDLVCYIT